MYVSRFGSTFITTYFPSSETSIVTPSPAFNGISRSVVTKLDSLLSYVHVSLVFNVIPSVVSYVTFVGISVIDVGIFDKYGVYINVFASSFTL